jgi:hypothetical protein
LFSPIFKKNSNILQSFFEKPLTLKQSKAKEIQEKKNMWLKAANGADVRRAVPMGRGGEQC